MSLTVDVNVWFEADGYEYLCFNHAIMVAAGGIDVDVKAGDNGIVYRRPCVCCPGPHQIGGGDRPIPKAVRR